MRRFSICLSLLPLLANPVVAQEQSGLIAQPTGIPSELDLQIDLADGVADRDYTAFFERLQSVANKPIQSPATYDAAWLATMKDTVADIMATSDVARAQSTALQLQFVPPQNPVRPEALVLAMQLYLALGNYDQAATLLSRIEPNPPKSFMDIIGDFYSYLANLRDAAEQAKATDNVLTLLRMQIQTLGMLEFDGRDEGLKNLRFSIFFHLQDANRLEKAAPALHAWFETTPPTPDDQKWIDDQATEYLKLTQLTAAQAGRGQQYGHAVLAVAYTDLLPDPKDIRRGEALRELAYAQSQLGRKEQAAITLARASALLADTPESDELRQWILADMANIAWEMDEPVRAAQLLAQTEAFFQNGIATGVMSAVDQTTDLLNRAKIYLDLADVDAAQSNIERAQSTFATIKPDAASKWNVRILEARIVETQARVLSEQGADQDAALMARKAVDMAAEILPDGHESLPLMMQNAADLLLVSGDEAGALALIDRAIEGYAAILPPNTPEALAAQSKRGDMLLMQGDARGAEVIYKAVARGYALPANRDQLAHGAFQFEKLAWLTLTKPDPTPADLDAALQALQWTFTTRSAEALAQLEARLLAGDSSVRLALRDRQDNLEAQRALRQKLKDAYAAGTALETEQALADDLTRLETALQDIDASLLDANVDPGIVRNVSQTSLADIQAALGPKDVAITFLLSGLRAERIPSVTGSANLAIAITRDDVVVGQMTEPSRAQLRESIRAFRCQLALNDAACVAVYASNTRSKFDPFAEDKGPETGFDTGPAKALYATLFGGVDHVLTGKDHVIIVPPGDLLGVPYAALVTATDDTGHPTYMIENHAISVLPSLASFTTLRTKPDRDTATGTLADFMPGANNRQPFIGFGDPTVGNQGPVDCPIPLAGVRSATGINLLAQDDNTGLDIADPDALRALSRLPDAKCELEAIQKRIGGKIHVGDYASEITVKMLNRGGSLAQYDYIAFATHGLVAGETGARSPGLLLTPPAKATTHNDGLLTAAEIADLKLTARLVVLSACNTAAGETGGSDGLSGLTRAFFHAGAEAVLVTQWAVYSSAAVEVSTGLFEVLAQSPGTGQAAALQQAITSIIASAEDDPFRAHPSYWAPFTMVGAT